MEKLTRTFLLLVIAGFYASIVPAQSVTLTNIPALDSHGSVVQGGSLYVTWKPFQGNNGTLIPGGAKNALIQNGVFSITLTASDNAGWPYNALLMGGTEPTVYLWKIPAAGGVTSIGQISKPIANTTSAVISSGASNTVASVAGTPMAGNCAGSWDANGDLVPASTPCSGGGVGAGTTGQFAYYASGGTAISGHSLAAADIPPLNYQAVLGFTPLNAASNLSDLTNVAAAKASLGLSASATTDTTNASNISSGTLAAARVAILNQNTTGNAATATTAGALTPTVYTVATLPGSHPVNMTVKISNGTTIEDCTIGGGTVAHSCQWTGSAWVAYLPGQAMLGAAGPFTVSASSTSYVGVSQSGGAATEASRQMPMPMACQAANLSIFLQSAQSSTGSLVITVRKASPVSPFTASATSLTITIAGNSAAGIYTDTVDTADFLAKDLLSIQAVNNATASSGSVTGITLTCKY